MAGETDEKRYTEEEFALILRRAIEMETPEAGVPRDPPPQKPSPEGLTLTEIQEIAAEVGVHPARVLEAADALAAPEWSGAARLFGGPATLSAERSVTRRLTAGEMARLLDLAREILEREGEAHEVLGGVEWKSKSELMGVTVRATPHGPGSKISLAVDRRGVAFLSHWVPMMGGLLTAAITLAALDPAAWQPIVAVVAGGVTTGYAVGRTVWTRSTKRWKNLVERLTAKMVVVAETEGAVEALYPGDEVGLPTEGEGRLPSAEESQLP
jgi:hypothetical protein